MNWLHACFGIGITITPVIMTAVFAANQSWRLGYVIVSICYAVVTVLYFLARSRWQDSRPVETEDEAAPTERISMGTTLRLPIVWLGIGMMFLVAAMETTPGNWIFTLFTEGRGIPEVAAAQWVSVFWGSFTVGRIFLGAIINRVNTQMLVYVCLIGAMAGAGLLWWNFAPWVGYAGLTLLGFAQAPIYPVLTSNTPRRVGRRHAANAIGFQVAAAGAGLSLIPALAGVLAAATSLEAIPPLIFAGTAILLALYQLSVMASAKVKHAEDW
jgi:fucose permease